MSKSAENDNSRINLLDPPNVIVKKIKKCKTDNGYEGLEWDNPDRPECTNLLTIYQAVGVWVWGGGGGGGGLGGAFGEHPRHLCVRHCCT